MKGKPKRTYARKRVYRRKRKTGQGKVHNFVQTVVGQTIYNDPIASNGFGFNFQLANCSQVSTFGDLFDQYRINKVVIKLMPRAQTTHANGTAIGTTPSYMYHVCDYDDANVPATLNEILEYENCRTVSTCDGKVHTITLKPHIALAAFSGAFTSYANARNQWLDCASTTIQHYGWKAIMPPAGIGNAVGSVQFDVIFKYYLSFKNVR